MKPQEKLVLIDGNALVHRAFHALPPLSQKGEPTNAVYGFTSVLLKVIRELKPDYIVATFDLPEPTFRHKAFDEYKIHRPKTPDDLISQFPKVKEVLSAFSIPILEKAGFEADDIIGTVCRQAKDRAPDVKCVIITGDLDTLQLINENTEVCTLKKGMSETVIYNDKAVRDRFSGLAPEQMSDAAAMQAFAEDSRGKPYAFVVYQPGGNPVNQSMTPHLVTQWITDTLAALVVAWVLALGALGFGRRVLVAGALGLFSALTISLPHWNWYRFPLDFTAGTLVGQVVGWTLAGAAIAWWLGRKRSREG